MKLAYTLATSYVGESLLSGFNWVTSDPNNGFSNYQTRDGAQAMGLYSVDQTTGAVRLGVDYTNVIPLTAKGRPSIRLESKMSFNHGLFIADFLHMPPSQCGLWPAFWAYGPNWPNSGEVDIVEGVNTDHTNLISAHTSDGCTISDSLDGSYTSQIRDRNCFVKDQNIGCGFSMAADKSSYGDSFNAINGGIYAMEWTSDLIKVWHFPRNQIPNDIVEQNPDPTSWKKPAAVFGGPSCDVDTHFKSMNLVLNTNFFGDWAGGVWGNFDMCARYAPTCKEYVANNPAAFSNTYWDVQYIRVYTGSPANSSSTAAISSSTKTRGSYNSTLSSSHPTTTFTITNSTTTTTTIYRTNRRNSTVSGSFVTGVVRNSSSQTSLGATSAIGSASSVANTSGAFRSNTLESSIIVGTSDASRSPVTETSSIAGTSDAFRSRIVETSSVAGTSDAFPSSLESSTAVSAEASATSIGEPAVTDTPTNPSRIGQYINLGCFGSSKGFPTFTNVGESDSMTISMCINLCNGRRFVGVYRSSCYCASALDADTRATSAQEGGFCNIACPGNKAQFCGGDLGVARNAATNPLNRRAIPSNNLLTMYGFLDDCQPPPPPPPLGGKLNVTYTQLIRSTIYTMFPLEPKPTAAEKILHSSVYVATTHITTVVTVPGDCNLNKCVVTKVLTARTTVTDCGDKAVATAETVASTAGSVPFVKGQRSDSLKIITAIDDRPAATEYLTKKVMVSLDCTVCEGKLTAAPQPSNNDVVTLTTSRVAAIASVLPSSAIVAPEVVASRLVVVATSNLLLSKAVVTKEIASKNVASDVVAPKVVASDVVAPKVVASDVVAPKVVASDVVAPDVVAPEVATPKAIESDVAVSDVSVPETVSQEVASPAIALPDTSESPKNMENDSAWQNLTMEPPAVTAAAPGSCILLRLGATAGSILLALAVALVV